MKENNFNETLFLTINHCNLKKLVHHFSSAERKNYQFRILHPRKYSEMKKELWHQQKRKSKNVLPADLNFCFTVYCQIRESFFFPPSFRGP